jgi:calcium permeable stress-gated cation channel
VINNSYDPLINPLSLSLANQTFSARPVDASDDAQPSPQQDKEGGAKEVSTKKKTVKRMLTDDEYGFAQPALSRPQRVVWIPRDTLGLGEVEEEACEAGSVLASTENAVMNEKGDVDIEGGPPDDPEM